MLVRLLLCLAVLQVAAPAANGTLRITVLERGTDAPLTDTGIWIVRAGSDAPPGRTVRTGPDGVAVVEDLPAGRYIVQVKSDTHLRYDEAPRPATMAWPADRPDLPVDVSAPGEARVTVVSGGIQNVLFKLKQGSQIYGRVVRAGRPVVGATLELVRTQSRTVLDRPVAALSGQVKSNADGSFRFSGLVPNTYLVRAHPDQNASSQFNSVYYPGVLDIRDATRVAVGSGTVDEIVFNLEQVPTVRVSGRVVDSGEGGVREVVVRRMDEETGDAINYILLPLKADGTWVWDSAQSGVHAVRYTRRSATGNRLLSAAWRVFYVGGEPLRDLELGAVAAASMRGSFEFSGDLASNDDNRFARVTLRPEGVAESIRWGLHDGGGSGRRGVTLSIEGIVGANIVDVDAPEGWVAEAVVLPDGRNILDQNFPFEPGRQYDGVRVILSDRVATIRGVVPAGTPLNPGVLRVIAFPEDDALRRVERHARSAEVDIAGHFAISDLRPGIAYLVSTCGWPCSSGYEAENLNEMAATATRIYIDRPGVFTVTLKPPK